MNQQKLGPEQIAKIWPPLLGVAARTTDIMAIEITGGTIEAAAVYIWDHWLGEPDRPTSEDIEGMISNLLETPETS